MRHLRLLIAFVILSSAAIMTVLAQGEPMANPECAADQLGDIPDQIDQFYADGQTALEDGDVRTWLDSLRAVSWLTSSLRAFCDGYVFEGDGEGSASQVFGPVIFQPGIYTVTATTDGPIIARTEEIDGECRLSIAVNEGEAAEGAQEVFRVEDNPCTALLEVSLLREDWRVEFSLISAGG